MPVKIYFCDGCNESIPVRDLNAHRVTFDSGSRIYCAKCGGKAPSRSFRPSAGLLAGFGGVVLVAALAHLGGKEVERIHGESNQFRSALTRIENDLNRHRADAFTRAEAERMLAPLIEASERTRRDFTAADERLRALDDNLRAASADLGGRLGRVEVQGIAASAVIDECRRRLDVASADLGAARAALDELGARIAALAPKTIEPARPAAHVAPPVAPTAVTAEAAEFARLSSMLKEPDAGRRYEAVNGLANLHVDGCVDALETALGDGESYVRDAAVRALRRHASLKSVPRIIAALRDVDLFVRTSAKAALKQLVGMDPPFDPDADAGKREKGVRDFEAWWAANADKFLAAK